MNIQIYELLETSSTNKFWNSANMKKSDVYIFESFLVVHIRWQCHAVILWKKQRNHIYCYTLQHWSLYEREEVIKNYSHSNSLVFRVESDQIWSGNYFSWFKQIFALKKWAYSSMHEAKPHPWLASIADWKIAIECPHAKLAQKQFMKLYSVCKEEPIQSR